MGTDDRDTIIAMLTRAGIEYTEGTHLGNLWIEVERGYIGFSTAFVFSPDGRLINVAAGES